MPVDTIRNTSQAWPYALPLCALLFFVGWMGWQFKGSSSDDSPSLHSPQLLIRPQDPTPPPPPPPTEITPQGSASGTFFRFTPTRSTYKTECSETVGHRTHAGRSTKPSRTPPKISPNTVADRLLNPSVCHADEAWMVSMALGGTVGGAQPPHELGEYP